MTNPCVYDTILSHSGRTPTITDGLDEPTGYRLEINQPWSHVSLLDLRRVYFS